MIVLEVTAPGFVASPGTVFVTIERGTNQWTFNSSPPAPQTAYAQYPKLAGGKFTIVPVGGNIYVVINSDSNSTTINQLNNPANWQTFPSGRTIVQSGSALVLEVNKFDFWRIDMVSTTSTTVTVNVIYSDGGWLA